MLTKFSSKCTRDNFDKSAGFVFDDSEAKILRNEELCSSENHKLTSKTSFITKRFNQEYKKDAIK